MLCPFPMQIKTLFNNRKNAVKTINETRLILKCFFMIKVLLIPRPKYIKTLQNIQYLKRRPFCASFIFIFLSKRTKKLKSRRFLWWRGNFSRCLWPTIPFYFFSVRIFLIFNVVVSATAWMLLQKQIVTVYWRMRIFQLYENYELFHSDYAGELLCLYYYMSCKAVRPNQKST